jgi:hypothetical protein
MKMKTINRILLILIILVGASLGCAAQSNVELTAEQKLAFQTRAKEKIDEYQHYLGEIASKNVSMDVKTKYIQTALKLFIGGGYNYEDVIDHTNHNAVRTEVSSVHRSRVSSMLTRNYLTALTAMRYTKVNITSGEAVRVDNIQQIAPGKYKAVAYICQKFSGYMDNRLTYTDVTHKAIEIYIEKVPTPGEDIWKALLGDIQVLSTSRR